MSLGVAGNFTNIARGNTSGAGALLGVPTGTSAANC